MTVTYSGAIATTTYATFFRLLGRWKGSIFKLIWIDLLVFVLLYSTFAITYHLIPTISPGLLEFHRQVLKFHIYVSLNSNTIPLSFILGFFVTLVVKRWIDQFNYLPTPDGVSLLTCSYIQVPPGRQSSRSAAITEQEVLTIRQTIIRYVNLAAALCFSDIAPNVRNVYQNLQSFVSGGLMTETELESFVQVDPRYSQFYIPLMWSIAVLKKAKCIGFIRNERHLNSLVNEILQFRRRLFTLTNYERVPIPLVYIQVVNIGVYAFYVTSIISGQFPKQLPEELPSFSNITDLITSRVQNQTTSTQPPFPVIYVPIFSILQLVFYLGWLKVAQSLLNPFGNDDEDFDLLPLMERNLAISMWMIDLQHSLPSQFKEVSLSSRRVSFMDPVDNLRFQQRALNGDPLSELLTASADLTLPDTLNSGVFDDSFTGSAARAFGQRESKTDSLFGADRRTSRSVAALVHLIHRKISSSSEISASGDNIGAHTFS